MILHGLACGEDSGYCAPSNRPLALPRAMPDLVFIQPDGTEHGFEAPAGVSLMAAATGMGVPGLLGECGGQAQCATCHVIVEPAWAARLPPPLPRELEMLEVTACERQPTSRLACQVALTDAMQGLVVRLPERQQ